MVSRVDPPTKERIGKALEMIAKEKVNPLFFYVEIKNPMLIKEECEIRGFSTDGRSLVYFDLNGGGSQEVLFENISRFFFYDDDARQNGIGKALIRLT